MEKVMSFLVKYKDYKTKDLYYYENIEKYICLHKNEHIYGKF